MRNETLADLMAGVSGSPIGAVFNKAVELRAQGRDLIDLSLGEPDFDTPEHIRAAAISAINAGQTRYTASDGTAALKDAISRKFSRDNGLSFSRAQIVVAAGAKPLIASALQVILNPGDAVILPTPVWTSHVGMVQACGAVPVLVATGAEHGFRLSAAQLAAAITPATRMLILCSPSNPTGSVYSAADLAALAEVLRRHPGIVILSDDLYEHIVFAPARFATLAQVAPDLAEHILTVNGVSKAYAMTGWRIGYAGGPTWWTDGLRTLFSQTNGGPCSISQAAAIAALDGPQAFLADWCETYRRRVDITFQALAQVPGLTVTRPEGAFFMLPGCAALIGRHTPAGRVIASSSDLAGYLLEAGVVVVPGPAFYCDPYFRLSVATSEANIIAGIGRIAVACTALSTGE
ncbi:MAG: pyridoxal phosphate-dependent aminotransferase [Pseudorhodobacter sp.]|nr:pyridoxal phosphate-dependent aminotransferase [Pseudorhodobacter sp.]